MKNYMLPLMLLALPMLFICSAAHAFSDTTLSFSINKAKDTTFTVRYVAPYSPPSDSLMLSDYASLKLLIDAAIAGKKIAVIDEDVTASQKIIVNGPITIVGYDNPTISTKLDTLFSLREGKHKLYNFNIYGGTYTCAIATTFRVNGLWDNFFYGLDISHCKTAYYSARGGIWNPITDVVQKYDTTLFQDCNIQTSWINLAYYSQDGPCKYLAIINSTFYSDTSHNLYVHPNVSLRFEDQHFLHAQQGSKAGTIGVAMHNFSGGGVVGLPKFRTMKNVYTNGYLMEVNNPNSTVTIDSSIISTYGPFKVNATNSKFIATGYGSYVYGSFKNCTGDIWPTGATTIDSSAITNIDLRGLTDTLTIKNSTVTQIVRSSNNSKPIVLILDNTVVDRINLPRPATLILRNGGAYGTALWNSAAILLSITQTDEGP